MIGFLIIIHTIVSILLISVVLMQASQGGGLSGTFGGQAASSILGGQGAGNILSKITGWLAAILGEQVPCEKRPDSLGAPSCSPPGSDSEPSRNE